MENNVKKAIVVSIRSPGPRLDETIELAKTAGYNVLHVFRQKRSRPHSKFYIGPGKLNEIKSYLLRDGLGSNDVCIILDGSIKPSQAYNIMKILNTKVIDRTQLILEIFAKHAGSTEAKLQIELAKLRHMLPFIKEWIRISRREELPGFLGGGVYEIDAYYKYVKKRISKIRRKLEELRKRRRMLIVSRKEKKIPHVTITGYTSAGKTELFNALTNESKKVSGLLFTTLSPKSKAVVFGGRKIIFTDTVGFINDVPVEIIEAFYSTLEEIIESDMILLVVDVSDDEKTIKRKVDGCIDALRKIEATSIPILLTLNKIDLVSKQELSRKTRIAHSLLASALNSLKGIVAVSAKERINIYLLLEKVYRILFPHVIRLRAKIPCQSLYMLKSPIRLLGGRGEHVICEFDVPQGEVRDIVSLIKWANGELIEISRIG